MSDFDDKNSEWHSCEWLFEIEKVDRGEKEIFSCFKVFVMPDIALQMYSETFYFKRISLFIFGKQKVFEI